MLSRPVLKDLGSKARNYTITQLETDDFVVGVSWLINILVRRKRRVSQVDKWEALRSSIRRGIGPCAKPRLCFGTIEIAPLEGPGCVTNSVQRGQGLWKRSHAPRGPSTMPSTWPHF